MCYPLPFLHHPGSSFHDVTIGDPQNNIPFRQLKCLSVIQRWLLYIYKDSLYASSGCIKCSEELFGLYQLLHTDLRNPEGNTQGHSCAHREVSAGTVTATSREVHFVCYLEIEVSHLPLLSFLFYPPAFSSDGRAQMLGCAFVLLHLGSL